MKQFKMISKNKKVGFLSMLLSALGASFLGNILAGKGMNRTGKDLLQLVMDLQSKARIFYTALSLQN